MHDDIVPVHDILVEKGDTLDWEEQVVCRRTMTPGPASDSIVGRSLWHIPVNSMASVYGMFS